MKKNYTTGLISGICGASILFIIIGTIFILVNGGMPSYAKDKDDGIRHEDSLDNKDADKSTDSNKDGKAVEKTENKEDFGKIVDKLEFLEDLIDDYFLEEVDKESYADGIYKGFVSSLEDPYSSYFTAEEYSNLIESSSGVYQGIGATVSQDIKTGIITIVKPFKDGPAYKAGLLPGDIIYKVENEEVTGMDLSEVVSRMKGMEGTKVNISILRNGVADEMSFTLTRQEIKVPTIEYRMLDDNIGYIIISEFDDITISQFNDAIKDLEKMGMKGLVVDVRNNPGGLLVSVVKILDRILPKGLIVYTEDKYGRRVTEEAVDNKECDIPISVLINGNSASAAEIFAGALQDYQAATIVGTTSFGKGIVQKVIPLTDGTAIKLTISKYYTPNGRNIHGTGIVPDVEIDLPDELKQSVEIKLEDDNQLQEAIRIVKDKLK